jgi:hypothetical protein
MFGKLLIVDDFVIFQDFGHALLYFEEGDGEFLFKLRPSNHANFFLLCQTRYANVVHFEKLLEILVRDFQRGTIHHYMSFKNLII